MRPDRRRRRAFTPSLDALPNRIAPTAFAPIDDPNYPDGNEYMEVSYGSWEETGMDSFCDPLGYDELLDMLD